MRGAFFLVIALVAAGAFYVNIHLKEKRRAGWRAAAAALGWRLTSGDAAGLLALPFGLLRAGDGRGIDHTLSGDADGAPAHVFDFWYYEQTTNAQGHTTRNYSRFTCALLQVPLRCAPTTIERETILTRLADVVGFRDQEFESEEFNRAFQVKSADPRFASYLIDARMMDWLLATNGDCRFELSGSGLLCTTRRLDPARIPWLLERARGFRDTMPRVVHDVYGSDA